MVARRGQRRYVQATFGPRGQRMFDDLHAGLDRGRLVLLDEACRAADRLDQLDRVLTGDVETWMRLDEVRGGDGLEVRIDSAAAEARQLANTLRQLIQAIAAKSDAGEMPETGGSASDDLARRAAERRAAASSAGGPA